MRKLVLAMTFVGLFLAARTASAEYVCQAWMVPGATTGGNSGFVEYIANSAPGCTGSFLGQRIFCSSGATASTCASSASAVNSDLDLHALISLLTQAVQWDIRVTLSTGSCIGGGTGCANLVQLNAN
jgi:hypothetical protein